MCVVSSGGGISISTSMGYLMLKPFLEKNISENKGGHTFPKGITLKANIRAWLEFKYIYFEATVQHFSHNIMGTTLQHRM